MSNPDANIETKNNIFLNSTFELTEEINLAWVNEEDTSANGSIRKDDILAAVWSSSDDQPDCLGDMDIDLPLTGIHSLDVISLAPDENPVSDFNTDGIFPTLDFGYDSVFERSLSPTFSSESGCETSIPPKRKRGRKSKLERAQFIPRPKKPQKTRIYEIEGPFEDKELERKRLCAINAKKHRDSQKNQMKDLEQKLLEATRERDSLKSEKECLATRVDSQSQRVELYRKHLADLALSSVTILQSTS